MFDQIFARGDGLDMARQAFAVLSLAASFAYLLIERRPPSALRTLLKTLSIGLLVPLPLLLLPGAGTAGLVLLALALALSSLGDIFLALKGDARNFPRGLAAFLVSHLFYLAVMLPLAVEPSGGALLASLLLLIAMATHFGWLSPGLGRLRFPVAAYLAAIGLMALAALAVPGAQPWLGLGAVLFVISDGVIAADKFRRPVPLRGFIVWTTYYGGQALMAASLLSLLA